MSSCLHLPPSLSTFKRAFVILFLWFSTLATAIYGCPPVSYVTVTATNPVDGLRLLAKEPDASFQVFLWRAHRYVEEQFRGESYGAVRKKLEEGGAEKIEEWKAEDGFGFERLRYCIQIDVIKSKLAQSSRYILQVQHDQKTNVTWVDGSIVINIGMDYKTAASKRDFPKDTVLDRVFDIIDLERRAQETPKLESIEISYGGIGYISTPDLGWGFHLEVALSNPAPTGRLKDQNISYMACTGLEPLGRFYTDREKPAIHVARDILVPGAAFDDAPLEHGHPNTFGSTGSGETPRMRPP